MQTLWGGSCQCWRNRGSSPPTFQKHQFNLVTLLDYTKIFKDKSPSTTNQRSILNNSSHMLRVRHLDDMT